MDISKEQFLKAYNSYPPNKFIKFAYKYFSKETVKNDLWLKRIIVGILITLFLGGFIGTIFKIGRTFIGTITIIFSIMLAILVLSLFAAVFMNNARIGKIRKALGGISKQEYNDLVDIYGSL